MDFRLLGPLEVSSGGELLELAGPKQRALLAMLLLEANRVVSTDRLIAALWEDDPPETALKALQVHVSGLRKLLGKERVATRERGYLLRVEEDELDLDRFRSLRDLGRLREALALWRGPPLCDFAALPFAQSDLARLEDERLACLEERIDQDLRAGRHAELTGELEGLVKAHPLRERLRGLSMLALYRAGRQAQALAVYQEARRVLVEELGIEPGKPLRDLHQAILNQDPALDLPLEAAAASPPAEPEPPADSLGPEPGICDRCGGANPPEARFCLACGAGLNLERSESRRLVTVLFCDVTGSTALGEGHDPEQLRRVLSRYAREARAVVTRHGGTVEKFIGDAVMALFGHPAVHEDDALRAARAALELRANLAQLNETLEREYGIAIEIRIGINSGEVVSGDPRGGDGFVTGDPVNVAKRLEEAAEPGEILIGAETYLLARDALRVEQVAPLSLKGKQAPIDAYRLVGVIPSVLPRTRRFETPLIGRERELALLQYAFERAVNERACHLFTVRGSAGVGKSRLVAEALARLDRDVVVLRGACLPYGEGITFWPVLEVVKQATGISEEDTPEQAREKIVAVLEPEESAAVLADRIAGLLGLAEASGSADEGFSAFRKLLESLAQRQPLVLILDDLNWAESMLLDLVEHVAEWSRDAPILLVCLARPELIDARPGWGGGKPNATSIFLEPLSDDESSRLIEHLVGSGLPDDVRARIQAAAAGNPLYVEEMVAMLLDEGRLRNEDGRWVVGGDLADLRVPASIKVLIASRIDQLAPAERRVLECAAVEGNVFHRGAVAGLAGADEEGGVEPQLRELVRKELVRLHRPAFPGEEGFCFRHPLIREATYESMPKETRSRLHERLASWLEEAVGDGLGEHDELLGYHREQAFRLRAEIARADEAARALGELAAEHLAAAGRRALARNDVGAASKLLGRALSLHPDDAAALSLRIDLSEALLFAGDFAAADRLARDAEARAAAAGDRCGELRAQLMTLRIATMAASGKGHDRAPSDALLALAHRAIPVFEQAADAAALTDAWAAIAWTHLFRCQFAAMLEAVDRGLAYAERAGKASWSRELLGWRSSALFAGPTPAEDVLAWHEEQQARHPLALWGCAVMKAMGGSFEDARALIAAGDASAAELGQALLGAAGGIFGWNVEMLDGRIEAAEACAGRSCELLEEVGDNAMRATACGYLAESLYRQDRLEEAARWTEAAERLSTADDVFSQMIWRQVRAKVLARADRHSDAEKYAREALELAEPTDMLNSRGNAHSDLAEVLTLAGREDQAAAELGAAIDLYEAKGNVVAAASVRRRLAELEPATPAAP
jgi:class 3 adenylate cyclase/DNA-binding SARP family transcriptional activator